MLTSSTAIANLALLKLGEGPILDITEDSNRAREMNRAYAAVRDAELNRHVWRFSIQRVSLPALVATPDSDYGRQFELPGGFIRLLPGGDIRTVADTSDFRDGFGLQYSIEGRRLLTNLSAPLAIRYIAQITDTTLFTPAFDEAFASRLAYTCCERITQSLEKQDRCLRDYKTALREATLAQALELASEPIGDDTWMASRLG